MKNYIEKGKGKRSQIAFLVSTILSATVLGNLAYNYDNIINKENNNNLKLLSLLLLPPLPVQASILNTSLFSNNTPIGSNITREEIMELASLFNDQPFQGGQVSPRVSIFINGMLPSIEKVMEAKPAMKDIGLCGLPLESLIHKGDM